MALILLTTAVVHSQSLPPSIFYSDLDSGPNSGGLNNLGAFVTIYGNNFGSTQGSSYVTIGGGVAAAYQIWTNNKVVFQLGSSAQTGGIVIHSTNGTSNSAPFAVRSGNLYFVAVGGSDSNNGSITSPWATLLHARDTMMAGDITYARDGVAQSTDDGTGWDACFSLGGQQGGTAGWPKAIVGYPGETATIGAVSGCGFGIRNRDGGENYYTIANLTLRGGTIAVGPGGGANWRVIGNDVSCPNGNGQAGCVDIMDFSYLYFYGNNIHNVATNLSPGSVTALYHGVYLSQQNDHIYFGWNTIAYVQGCRGFQQNINSGSDAADVYDLYVHDNLIHDTQCDGILADAMNPSQGAVAFYNNVIYNAGTGPNNAEASGSWTCMTLWSGEAPGTPQGSGVIQVYNNTMYNCGSFANPPYAGSSAGFMWEDQSNATVSKQALFQNNIVHTVNGNPSFIVYNSAGICTANCPEVRGSNNIFYGSGGIPANSQLTASLNVDPLFVSPSTGNFHLQSGSPAAIAGATTPDVMDFDGVLLPQGAAYPIGAFALPLGGSGPTPSISININPSVVSLSNGGTAQFNATVTAVVSPLVTWSISPLVGTVSPSGLYTAPATINAPQTIMVTASVLGANLSSTAVVNLSPTVSASPALTPTVSCTISNGAVNVTWSGPTGLGYGAIVLTSPDAPVWWAAGSTMTQNTVSGTSQIPLPSQPGLYQCRYLAQSQYTVLAQSDIFASNNAGFNLTPSATSQKAGSTVNVSWTAGAGRTTSDYIGLFRIGDISDNPTAWFTTNGDSAGTETFVVPYSGSYEFRYILGAPPYGYTYITVTKSGIITSN